MTRSLLPREHGAYAQLAAPLVTALVTRSPTIAAVALAVAGCAAFLANEPLLVVLGHRGARRRETDGKRAARRLVSLAIVAANAAVLGLVRAPCALAITAVVAIPAIAMFAIAWRRAAHSLTGELVAAFALPGASAPVAVAAGAPWQLAVATWAAWSLGYACCVVAVHRVIDRRAASGVLAIAMGAIALASLVALPVAAPLAIAGAGFAIFPPHARHLRAIGFVLVIASIASGVVAFLT